MSRRRPLLARLAAAILVTFVLALATTVAVTGAAISYTLSGTVTQSGCGHGGHKCAVLPKGERISIGISDSSAVATVPVDSSGHYSVSLPAGGYFVTPGVGDGPVEIERFTPEQRQVDLSSDQTANFTYTVAEPPPPLGYLHLSGALANVAIDSFSLPQGHHGPGFGPLGLVTAEVGLQPALVAAVGSGKVYPVATFDVFKKGTRTRTLQVAMRGAQLTGEQLAKGDREIDFTLVAKEGSLNFAR